MNAQAATFAWSWRGRPVAVAYEEVGDGPTPVLCLPAFSTVSTREELRPLATLLAGRGFNCILLDRPGFGGSERPRLDYGPALFRAFLPAFAEGRGPALGIVACGHAAGYALDLARARPGLVGALVLVAPTWRGPLPTAMGEHRRAAYAWVRRAVRAPVLGELLYRANTSAPVLRLMMRRHVYSEAGTVSPALVEAKRRIARRRGARFGSAAFVTGALDPVPDRGAFLALLDPPPAPIAILQGEATPPRSAAEMDAMAALAGIEAPRVPGALSPHEEHATVLAPVVARVLKRHLGPAGAAVERGLKPV